MTTMLTLVIDSPITQNRDFDSLARQVFSWSGLKDFSDSMPALLILPMPARNGKKWASDLIQQALQRVHEYQGGIDRVILSRNPLGKPLVDGFCYNLSFSFDWFALVLTRTLPVGIDIESKHHLRSRYERNPPGLQAVVQHFFTPQEAAILADVNHEDDSEQWINTFGRMWCYKESVIKALGLSIGSHGSEVESAGFRPDNQLPDHGEKVHIVEIEHPQVFCFCSLVG